MSLIAGPKRGEGRLFQAAAFSALLLAGLWFTHRAAFDAPFYFDTVSHLKLRTNLQLTELNGASLSAAVRSDFDGPVYRPLAQLSMALTHLGFGLSPRAYRVGNLLIHWAAGLAALFLCYRVLLTPRVRARNPRLSDAAWPVALAAAALWALHPLHTNLVSYVVQRMASLSGLFSLLAVGCYLRGRSARGGWSWGWAVLGAVSLALALASKENAVLVPLLLGAAEWLLLERRNYRERRILLGVTTVAVAGAALLVIRNFTRLVAYLNYSNRDFTLGERLFTQARLQLDYLGLLLWPRPGEFAFSPEVALSTGLLQPPATLLALALLAAAVIITIVWGRRWPLFAFAVAWYLVHQLLEATVIPLELYFEHRLYLPALAPALLLSGALWSVQRRFALGRPAALLVLAGALLFLGWSTLQRTAVWADPVRFWADGVEKAPDSARAHTNLGRELIDAGRLEEARDTLQRALELGQGKQWITYLQLAHLTFLQRDEAQAAEFLKASIAEVRTQNWEAPQRLGLLAYRAGRLDEAEQYLRDSLDQRGTHPETWRLLAAVHLAQGDLQAAEAAVGNALRYGPGRAAGWNTLGAVQFQRGDYAGAAGSFERATRLDPGAVRYRNNLREARTRGAAAPASTPP